MAHPRIVGEISTTSGEDSDGMFIGRVKPSDFSAAFTDVRLAASVTAYRHENSGFVDLSTALNDTNPSDAVPFDSAGDRLYISCEHKIKNIHVQVATAGVWTGTIAFKCSTNGTSANHTIATVTDNSNGFRAGTGWYSITPTLPADIKAYDPSPDDSNVPSRMWLILEPSITSITTAPVLTRAVIEHDDGSITSTNLTNGINTDLIAYLDGGGTLHPATFFPTMGSEFWLGFSDVPKGIARKIFQAFPNVRTREPRYLAADGTKKALTGWNDPSNDYKNGPATLTQTNITGITRANPCVITAPGHGRSVGNRVHITNVAGMTEINGQDVQITAISGDNLTVSLDSSGYTAYTSGGKITLFELYNVSITAPSDWTAKSKTFKTSSGDVTASARWLILETTAVSSYGPVNNVYANLDAKQFGNSNTTGIRFPTATRITGMTIEEPFSTDGTGVMEIQVINLSTGASSSYQIPANVEWPHNADFTDVPLAANEQFGVACTSGDRRLITSLVTIHTVEG